MLGQTGMGVLVKKCTSVQYDTTAEKAQEVAASKAILMANSSMRDRILVYLTTMVVRRMCTGHTEPLWCRESRRSWQQARLW